MRQVRGEDNSEDFSLISIELFLPTVNIPAHGVRWTSGTQTTNGGAGEQPLVFLPSDWPVSRYLSRKSPEELRKVLHCKYRDCQKIFLVAVSGLRCDEQGVGL